MRSKQWLIVIYCAIGLLMMIDIWQERGLSQLLEEYGDPTLCRFPLFNWLQPLPLVWMYIVYLVLFIGKYFQLILSSLG